MTSRRGKYSRAVRLAAIRLVAAGRTIQDAAVDAGYSANLMTTDLTMHRMRCKLPHTVKNKEVARLLAEYLEADGETT